MENKSTMGAILIIGGIAVAVVGITATTFGFGAAGIITGSIAASI